MSVPPFPEHLPVASLARISLAALIAKDARESDRLFQACCNEGFFLLDLTENPVGQQLLGDVEKAFEIGKEFFAEDQATKEEFKVNSGNVGYKPLGVMKFKDGKTDLTEICAVGRDSILDQELTVIPRVYHRERTQLQSTIARVHTIAMILLERLADHLDVPFSEIEAMHRLDSPSATVLRFLHNPPQRRKSSIEDRQASLLGHTDSGSVTILFAKIGGLQILPSLADEADESSWQWVRPEPGCAIVNIGDPLVQWTGGILRSAFHRVLYSPGEQAAEERYSFGYFLKPADEAPMNRLRSGKVIPPIENSDVEQELPCYDLWHQDKTKKIMRGHQDGVFRGGVRHAAEPLRVA